LKKFLTMLFVLSLFFVLTCNASATTFTGTASGQWTDVVSTDSGDLWWVNNNDIGGDATFNWGTAVNTPFNNQFTFDGIGSDGDPGWTTYSDTPFLIGNFFYRNGSTTNSTGIDGVTLDVLLSITNPLITSDSYDFAFSITNTPNSTGNPVLDGDIVTSIQSFSTTTFIYDDILYTLELLGFSNDGGSTILTDFSSPEGATASAGVYAKITQPPEATVPEPTTILLLGAGLLGFAGVSRKKIA